MPAPPSTPRRLAELAGSLSVHCPKCRELREFDLLALKVSGRFEQAFQDMRFKCGRCGSVGKPIVRWNDASGNWRVDVATGEVRDVKPPGFYHPARG